MKKTKAKRPGPSTPFGRKDPPNKSFTLTKAGKRICAAAAKRSRESESNVVEMLLRKYGPLIGRKDFEVWKMVQHGGGTA